MDGETRQQATTSRKNARALLISGKHDYYCRQSTCHKLSLPLTANYLGSNQKLVEAGGFDGDLQDKAHSIQ